MSYETKYQDPSDKLDYLNNWAAFLNDGETITASTWTAYTTLWVESDDVVLSGMSFTDLTATVWVEASPAGERYYITNHITTSEGRQKDATFQLIINHQ